MAVATFGMTPTIVRAEEGPVPEPCKLHPTHVVNPGCIPALTSDVRDPGITLPNISPDVQHVEIQRPFTFDEDTQTVYEGPLSLLFDGWVQNFGEVPLELVADDPNNPTTAMQCVSWSNHVCQQR